jgi:hypothetical protein
MLIKMLPQRQSHLGVHDSPEQIVHRSPGSVANRDQSVNIRQTCACLPLVELLLTETEPARPIGLGMADRFAQPFQAGANPLKRDGFDRSLWHPRFVASHEPASNQFVTVAIKAINWCRKSSLSARGPVGDLAGSNDDLTLAYKANSLPGLMLSHEKIIEKLAAKIETPDGKPGSQLDLAALLGVDNSRLSKWKIVGIPPRHWPALLRIAKDRGMPLSWKTLDQGSPLTSSNPAA